MAERDGGAGGLRVAQFRDARRGRPAWMRLLDAGGRLLPRLAAPSADAWWRSARLAVPGVEPDPHAVEALAALVSSLERDAALHLVGRLAARDDCVRMARTHLRIEAALREEPAILATALPEPVFIVGWPRTGTTFLHTLLAEDPAHRTLPYWESFDPVPPRGAPDRRAENLDRCSRASRPGARDRTRDPRRTLAATPYCERFGLSGSAALTSTSSGPQ